MACSTAWPIRPGSWSEKPNSRVGEFELIARIARRVRPSTSVVLGIGDDAAVLQPAAGQLLVATTDSLVLDRHFTAAWSPAEVGHLALAANLSDLAAMAARPRWVLLSLTLPNADERWLDGFLDGFLALAERFETCLVGGNISAGPLNIGVQLLGEVGPEAIARRSGVRSGDVLAVTGTLGDAAAALSQGEQSSPALLERLRRPEPRVHAAQALAGRVHAMIDVSDGLLADLAHLLEAGLGAELELPALPASPALRAAVAEPQQRWALQVGGGNDYELLMAMPPEHFDVAAAICAEAGTRLSAIGRVTGQEGIHCRDERGEVIGFEHGGWDHFGSG
jgi:thiamine-monophosphate kinase